MPFDYDHQCACAVERYQVVETSLQIVHISSTPAVIMKKEGTHSYILVIYKCSQCGRRMHKVYEFGPNGKQSLWGNHFDAEIHPLCRGPVSDPEIVGKLNYNMIEQIYEGMTGSGYHFLTNNSWMWSIEMARKIDCAAKGIPYKDMFAGMPKLSWRE